MNFQQVQAAVERDIVKDIENNIILPNAEQHVEAELSSPKHGVAGFIRFCGQHVTIQDRRSKREVPFVFFKGQGRVAPDLVPGVWLVLLKGRQLGMTWLLAAYCLWRLMYSDTFVAVIINQELPYAKDFAWRVRYMWERLPWWMRQELTTDQKRELRWETEGHNCVLRCVVGGEKAARSMTCDLAIVDEASRVKDLDATLAALTPAIETSRGQIVMLSSSAGRGNFFHKAWQSTYGDTGELVDKKSGVGPSGFKPIFIHWSEREGRDAAWFEAEKAKLDKISPVRMKQEHPDTVEEAWEYAAGRVYPLFTRARCVGDPDGDSVKDLLDAPRYRAIDWGQTTSPFVCLWVAHLPGPPGFLVSPSCPNAIREFFDYRYDEEKLDEPMKQDDHCPDAARYVVTTENLTGLVYIYRELYITDAVAKGWNPMTEIAAVHEASGWELADPDERQRWQRGRFGEKYEATVADRSWVLMCKLFSDNDIPCKPHKKIKTHKKAREHLTDKPLTEKLEGIRRVSVLIDGSMALEKRVMVRREVGILHEVEAQRAAGIRASISTEDQLAMIAARRLLKRARGRKRP